MIQKNIPITENRHISGSCYKMSLSGPEIAAAARPGQFVMVRPDGSLNPFLSRPFSIHRINKEGDRFELLYKIMGQATHHLAELTAGQKLNLVGPLGRGFRMDFPGCDIALVAGGIGVAPLVFLAQALTAKSAAPLRARVFIGGATGQDILCRDEFVDMKMEVQTATEDGSAGFPGLVTQLLEKSIHDRRPDMVFACGPPAMLSAVAQITAAGKIPCQVSVETIMACGIGACVGCAVKSAADTDGYQHVCRDGPVFFTTDIDLDSLVESIRVRPRIHPGPEK